MQQPRNMRGACRRCLTPTTALSIFVLMVAAAAASPCPMTGEPAPTVVTLMASTTDPAMEAWIVSPDCTVETIRAADNMGKLAVTVNSRRLQCVTSVPTDLQRIYLTGNSLGHGADLSKASNVTEVTISGASFGQYGLLLPPYLERLEISLSPELSLDDLKLPSSLQSLTLRNTPKLKTFRNAPLPKWLRTLFISDSSITANDFQFLPASLKTLHIDSSPIGDLENISLPRSLQTFVCDACSIKLVRGVKWPTSLRKLSLQNNTITTFEIYQSDATTFQKLDMPPHTTWTCSTTGEVLDENVTCREYGVAIKKFDMPYNISGEGSSSLELSDGSLATEGLHDSQTTTDSSDVSKRSSKDAPIADKTEVGSPTSVTIVVVVALSVFVVGLLCYAIPKTMQRKKAPSAEAPTADDFDLVHSPSASCDRTDSTGPTLITSTSLPIDIRNDRDLMRWRIDKAHIEKQVARGGYGVVYRGKCQGRVVAIKQMLPDTWQSDSLATSFLDEIRMCARLSHPKIVEFIGVAWNSLRDLSVITEFMAGGDLHSVIHKFPESLGAEWAHSWSQRNLRSKTLIAKDIAEAVVYLHSFDAPIIHRDLKTKNVLLDPVGNAKLSDFGISRAVSIDETMTSEIGTVAWIAPEVLRGERYSEKADIYSLGVLLVELDRCSHPYATEPALGMDGSINNGGGMSHGAHKNTQIAVLVSMGKLVPSPSRGCPEGVSTLINRCVSYEATHRPTAREVLEQLSQMTLAHENMT